MNNGFTAKDGAVLSDRKIVFRIGAVCAAIVIAMGFLDVVLSFIPGWEVTSEPNGIKEWLRLFIEKPFLGLRNLDLLNVIIAVFMVPVFFAVSVVVSETDKALAGLTFVFFLMGTIIFVVGNKALAMYALGREYSAAGPEYQKQLLEGAGTALLASFRHGEPSSFIGFFINEISLLFIAMLMLRVKTFGRICAWCGTIGMTIMIFYTVLLTFSPMEMDAALFLAVPGGLLSLVWNILVMLTLFQKGRKFSSSSAVQ